MTANCQPRSQGIAWYTTSMPTFEIFEDIQHIPERDPPVQRRLSLINLEPLLHPPPFPFAQELGLLREVRDDEEEQEGNDAGQEALDDEDPAPGEVAAQAVHVGQGGGEQAAEGAGQRGRGEEEGEALLGLRALVPHADQVEAAGEHAGFGEAEEEARRPEALDGADEALADGDEAAGEGGA